MFIFSLFTWLLGMPAGMYIWTSVIGPWELHDCLVSLVLNGVKLVDDGGPVAASERRVHDGAPICSVVGHAVGDWGLPSLMSRFGALEGQSCWRLA